MQAEALGVVFAADAPAIVVSSDLSRAAATARAVCEHVGLPLRLDDRLRETHFGEWQGLTGAEVQERWPERFLRWRSGEDHPVGGETPAEVGARAFECLEEVLAEVGAEETLLFVTHGGTARALTALLLEHPPELWWRLAPLGNTCWTTLVEAGRGWRLERHNTGLGPLVGPPTGAGGNSL